MKQTESSTEDSGITLQGLSASPGIAVGKALVYHKNAARVDPKTIDGQDVERHLQQFYRARQTLQNELRELQGREFSDEVADIINAQIHIVKDPDLAGRVEQFIRKELYAADYAIDRAFEKYLTLLSDSGGSQANEHSIDISDMRDRLIEVIQNDYSIMEITSENLLIAEELSPRQVIKLAAKQIKGIVMDRGGSSSHAVIIARSIGIPAVVGTKEACHHAVNDDMVAIDGGVGTVVIRPNRQQLEEFKKREEQSREASASHREIWEKPSHTKDGVSFSLQANVEFAEELELVKKVGAEGIGLLRTESIYLGQSDFDNIDRQQNIYHRMLDETAPHFVTIRLFDAGGDKLFPSSPKEQNPFLGWRGLRMLLDEPEMLHGQLKAILKTAGQFPGRVRLLVPMVTELDEVTALKKHINAVQLELSDEGEPIGEELMLGIMVEVPSVAFAAESFAGHVDFFSIGTNDLTQYVLASDRGNERIAHLYDQRHPVIWKLIHRVVKAGRTGNIPVAVCGELAADPESAACLMGMGIRELSMSPGLLVPVKKLFTSRKLKEMEDLAEKVLTCTTKEQVIQLFEDWNHQ